MKYLVTWTAPYLAKGKKGESLGMYGVEGRYVIFFLRHHWLPLRAIICYFTIYDVLSADAGCSFCVSIYCSKPGGPAVATYLQHRVIEPHKDGHGNLLGEVSFTCRRVSIILHCFYVSVGVLVPVFGDTAVRLVGFGL